MSTNKKLEIILLILALFIYISCDINIHIIPHVCFIFKTVLLSLTNNKEMTFIIKYIILKFGTKNCQVKKIQSKAINILKAIRIGFQWLLSK